MNTIGIDHNLNRARIRKLLAIGLFASILTGIGDFLLGYAEELPGVNFAASVMAGAPNLADWQMIVGGLLGFFGIFLEGLACFAVYRLMADAARRLSNTALCNGIGTSNMSLGAIVLFVALLLG